MCRLRLITSIIHAYFLLSVVTFVSSTTLEEKNSKAFSLFSVVTFQNAECTSSNSIAGGPVDGTCYTATECGDKGGTTSGNCASGFGVCCVFLTTAAAGTITVSENRSRLRNAEYNSYATATTLQTYVYTVNKMKSDICQLRIDFTNFVIAGPSNTVESITAGTGTNCADSFRVTTTDVATWSQTRTGTLCGSLTGEHLYVDLSPTSTDAATLTLVTVADVGTLTAAVAQRAWDIKVSQIECHATYRAPLGCDKYLMADHGKVTSYNFNRIIAAGALLQNSGLELALQNVNTCIRRAKNMCCVEFQACSAYEGVDLTDADNSAAGDNGASAIYNEAWSLDLDVFPWVIENHQVDAGLVDSMCISDYVEIPSSWSAGCGAGTSSARDTINTRYCGSRFGTNLPGSTKINSGTPVCDCSEPFVVRHYSDDVNDKGGLDEVAETNVDPLASMVPRGFCLDYKQVPCWQ